VHDSSMAFKLPNKPLYYVHFSIHKSLNIWPNVPKIIFASSRYLQYFSNMIESVKPRSDPLLLRRVIMNGIPKFGTQQVINGSYAR